jgi:hypothetical protein
MKFQGLVRYEIHYVQYNDVYFVSVCLDRSDSPALQLNISARCPPVSL